MSGYQDDTLTFDAWGLDERPALVTKVKPPRLYEIARRCRDTPKGERRNRLLLPPGCGPFGVGSFDVMTDPGPKGSFFRLFYPVTKWNIEKDPSIEYPPWIPSRRYCAGFAKYMMQVASGSKSIYMRFFEYHRSRIFIPTLTEAKLIRPDAHVQELPIIVYSHGLSSCRTLSSAICMDWASYGFVVAAVEHRDGSAAYTYHLQIMPQSSAKRKMSGKRNTMATNEYMDNGVYYVEKGMLIIEIKPFYDFNFRNHQLSHRRREMTNCLNALGRLNKGMAEDFLIIDPRTGMKGSLKFLKDKALVEMFKGRLNVIEVVAAGHSFGGATGLVTVLKDNRFKCGVLMDPWTTPLGPEAYDKNAFVRPFMIIDSAKWLSTKKELPLLRCLLADQVRALAACPANIGSMMCTIRDTNHQSFTDFMLTCGPKVGRMLELRENSDPVTVLQYIRQLSIAFIKAKTGKREIQWPQGSKHILEAVRCGQHIDIKHGQRFLGNNMLGYEMEVQRLITFERRANKDKGIEDHRPRKSERSDSRYKSIGDGKFVSSTMSVAKRQRQFRHSIERMQMDAYEFRIKHVDDGSDFSTISSAEFSEARSFYRKETQWSCCGCCKREVRKIKPKRRRKESHGNSISDVVWLHNATNYPMSICKWTILQNADLETAEKWLNEEAFRHGYRVENASLPRGLISLQREGNVCAMVEVDFHGRNHKAVVEVAKDETTHIKLQSMADVLTAQRDDILNQRLNSMVLSGSEIMSMKKSETSIKTIFLGWKTNPEIKLTLKKGAIYVMESNIHVTSLVAGDSGIKKSGNGYLAVMLMYEPVESAAITPEAKQLTISLCEHVLKNNPLTLGIETPATREELNQEILGSSYDLNNAASTHIQHSTYSSSFIEEEYYYGGETTNRKDCPLLSFNKSDISITVTTERPETKDPRPFKFFRGKSKTTHSKSKNQNTKRRKYFANHSDEECRLLFQRFEGGTVLDAIDNAGIRILDFVKFECREAHKDSSRNRRLGESDSSTTVSSNDTFGETDTDADMAPPSDRDGQRAELDKSETGTKLTGMTGGTLLTTSSRFTENSEGTKLTIVSPTENRGLSASEPRLT